MTTAPPASQSLDVIRSHLRRRIGRQWKPGEKLPSIRDLARKLGAGQFNTHRAVKALTEEGVLVSRERVGVFVAGAPDGESASPAPVGGSALAGLHVQLLLPQWPVGCLTQRLVEAFRERMAHRHCELAIKHLDSAESNDWTDRTEDECDAMAIFTGWAKQHLRVRPGLPVVAAHQGVNHTTQVEPLDNFDAVGVNNHHGSLLAGRHMRNVGIEQVAVIGSQDKDTTRPDLPRPLRYDPLSTERIEGFEHGFGRTIPSRHRMIAGCYAPSAAAYVVPAYLAMDPRPTGIFATSDDLALGFIHGALSHGLHPGRDYHIIGFDGQQAGRDLREGPLTTIDLQMEEIGRRAADLLAERMLRPDLPSRQFFIGGKLFAGRTVNHP